MSGRVIAGAVIVLVVVVGAIFIVIANSEGGDSNTGSLGSPHSGHARVPVVADR